MRTIGKITVKKYQCTDCGHIHKISTNHYGETYGNCPNCQWKNPMRLGGTHKCLEPPLPGMGIPKPWKRVKLSDICAINEGFRV